MASIIAALIGLFRAIPVVADLVKYVCEAISTRQKAANEADVQRRKADKDSAVDAWVDAPAVRVPDARSAGQLPADDGSSGRGASAAGGTGMGSGRAEDDQRAGI